MKQLRKKLWCLNLRRAYNHSEDLTALIQRCIWLIENCPDVTIEIDYYRIVIKTKKSTVELWNANKFYAWLSNGSVNGNKYYDMMPSKSVMYDFKECLRIRGYNIYKPEDEYKISPEDVM